MGRWMWIRNFLIVGVVRNYWIIFLFWLWIMLIYCSWYLDYVWFRKWKSWLCYWFVVELWIWGVLWMLSIVRKKVFVFCWGLWFFYWEILWKLVRWWWLVIIGMLEYGIWIYIFFRKFNLFKKWKGKRWNVMMYFVGLNVVCV